MNRIQGRASSFVFHEKRWWVDEIINHTGRLLGRETSEIRYQHDTLPVIRKLMVLVQESRVWAEGLIYLRNSMQIIMLL